MDTDLFDLKNSSSGSYQLRCSKSSLLMASFSSFSSSFFGIISFLALEEVSMTSKDDSTFEESWAIIYSLFSLVDLCYLSQKTSSNRSYPSSSMTSMSLLTSSYSSFQFYSSSIVTTLLALSRSFISFSSYGFSSLISSSWTSSDICFSSSSESLNSSSSAITAQLTFF